MQAMRRASRAAAAVRRANVYDSHSLFVLPLARLHEITLPASRNLSRAERIREDDVQPVHALDALDELIPIAHHQLDVIAVRHQRQRRDRAGQLRGLAPVEGEPAVIERVEEDDALGALVVQRDAAGDVLQVLAVLDLDLERNRPAGLDDVCVAGATLDFQAGEDWRSAAVLGARAIAKGNGRVAICESEIRLDAVLRRHPLAGAAALDE